MRAVAENPGDGRIDDPAIRAAWLHRLGGSRRGCVIEELGLFRGAVRLDIAVVTNVLHGIEIKSERDTLRRLPEQLAAYGQILDVGTLVVGATHADGALELAPPWWGVVAAERGARGALRFKRMRRGCRNHGVSARALSELIWRDEALSMLRDRNAARGLSDQPREVLWDHLATAYSTDELRAAVRRLLADRSQRVSAAGFSISRSCVSCP